MTRLPVACTARGQCLAAQGRADEELGGGLAREREFEVGPAVLDQPQLALVFIDVLPGLRRPDKRNRQH